MLRLHEYRGVPALPKATDLGPVLTADNVGLEIELEGLRIMDSSGLFRFPAPVGWTIHEDRSLRNNGVEFVFITPASGKEIWTRLNTHEDWFREHKLKPVASARTSVHVHIDAGDTNCGELLKWALIYTIYEPLLFSEFAPEREVSNFCVPIYNSVDSREVLGNLRGKELGYATTDWEDFYRSIVLQRETKRYAAMNLDAIRKFSTLEFRHIGGEYRATPIMDWVNVLLALKRWAMDPNTSIKDIFHGPSKMLADNMTYRIFEPRVATRFIFNRKFKELYFKGIRTAQEIYMQPDIPEIPPVLKNVIEAKKKERLNKNIKNIKDFLELTEQTIKEDVFEDESLHSEDWLADLPPELLASEEDEDISEEDRENEIERQLRVRAEARRILENISITEREFFTVANFSATETRTAAMNQFFIGPTIGEER